MLIKLNNPTEEYITQNEVLEIAEKVILQETRLIPSKKFITLQAAYIICENRTIVRIETIDRNNAEIDLCWGEIEVLDDHQKIIEAITIVDRIK